MGGSCGTHYYGDEEWCIEGFVGEALEKEALRRSRRRWGIIIKWIFKKWFGRACTLLSGSE